MTPRRFRLAHMLSALSLLFLMTGAGPAHSKGGNGLQGLVFVLAGPVVLLLWLGAAAVVYLIASSFRKQDGLVALMRSAGIEMGRGTVVFTLWGVLAEVLLVTAGLVFTRLPRAGLLVAVVWLTAIALIGLGAVVVAYALGRRLHAEVDGGEIAPLSAMGVGLRLLFVAAAFPVLGWLVVTLLAAYGAGAVLTAAARGSAE